MMRKLRTILITPKFQRMDLIQTVREKYDPAFSLVDPHITLCFPFKSFLPAKTIKAKVELAVKMQPFTLTAKGFSAAQVPKGNFLFLDIDMGRDAINTLQEQLYAKQFKKFRPLWLNDTEFYPHITVGKFDDVTKLIQAVNSPLPIETFECTVDRVYVEVILPNQKSYVESVIML